MSHYNVSLQQYLLYKKISFEVVCGRNHNSPLDLPLIPTTHSYSGDVEDRVKNIKKANMEIHDRIVKKNKEYNKSADKHRKLTTLKKVMQFGSIFARRDFQKEVMENAYKIKLSGDYIDSATFNVADLSPYYGEQEDEDEIQNSN